MERKIGEIFEYNGEWYQAINNANGIMCSGCVFVNEYNECEANEKVVGSCGCRNDNKLIFKKLEKVGEPYAEGNSIVSERMFQKYRTYEKNFFLNERDLLFTSYGDIVSIEIKQNKEDMEEKKYELEKLLAAFVNSKITYAEYEEKLEDYYKSKYGKGNMEEKKLDLKPFDLEAAKAGKPVCTRDGRKARIICFDRNDLYPIVALIECEDGKEMVGAYSKEGQTEIYEIKGTDLMMLPEKKEGWVNVYKMSDGQIIIGQYPYESEDYCRNIGRTEDGYINTIKIEWNE